MSGPRKIAIIGGGTAGWLVANHLAVELRAEPDVEITVIESPEIGIIGVGEGTVPHLRNSLMKFGISEAELLSSCDCTFKYGIRFSGWLSAEKHGADNFYYHPFSSPYPGGYDVTPFYLRHAESMAFHSLTEVVTLAEASRCPKSYSSAPFQGAANYAYHFNAVKFGQLLARNACERLGVRRKLATIVDVSLDTSSGDISTLITDAGEVLAFDYFIDCSGFRSLLLGDKLGTPFLRADKKILTDAALAIQVPIDNEQELKPFTHATAHQAGWIWDIPLTTRRGVGFVYASQYLSEQQALQQLASYLNVPEDACQARRIPMQMGYREQFWVKNCVGLGLAQGFVEPLEATSILVTDFVAELFARHFPLHGDANAARNYCNRVVRYTWERVMDFVQMHYCLSDRDDSAFWRANRFETERSEVLQERLSIWQCQAPQKSDFFSRFDLFDVDNYLYVLYGMRYKTRARPLTSNEEAVYARELQRVGQRAEQMQASLPGHRQWLREFCQAVQQAR